VPTADVGDIGDAGEIEDAGVVEVVIDDSGDIADGLDDKDGRCAGDSTSDEDALGE
jgi:hypothetical protein